MQTPLLNAVIRDHITATRAHFGSVEFIKKDGTLRRLTFQQAAMRFHVKGTERGQRAALTRARNHPNLLTVWDVHKRAFRTVNLDTVLSVTTHRERTDYRRIPYRGVHLMFFDREVA